jgi:hypothetical protein
MLMELFTPCLPESRRPMGTLATRCLDRCLSNVACERDIHMALARPRPKSGLSDKEPYKEVKAE